MLNDDFWKIFQVQIVALIAKIVVSWIAIIASSISSEIPRQGLIIPGWKENDGLFCKTTQRDCDPVVSCHSLTAVVLIWFVTLVDFFND